MIVSFRKSTQILEKHSELGLSDLGHAVLIERNQAVVGVILKRVLRRIDSSIKIIIRLTDKH